MGTPAGERYCTHIYKNVGRTNVQRTEKSCKPLLFRELSKNETYKSKQNRKVEKCNALKISLKISVRF